MTVESMSGNIIQLNDQFIHNELKTIVKNSVEETVNALLDAEADKLVQAERYARGLKLYFRSEKNMETPMMNIKNGNTKSVGVRPFQRACSKGVYTHFHTCVDTRLRTGN